MKTSKISPVSSANFAQNVLKVEHEMSQIIMLCHKIPDILRIPQDLQFQIPISINIHGEQRLSHV